MMISNNKKPEIALFQNAGIFKKTSELLIVSKNNAPNAAPNKDPVPPLNECLLVQRLRLLVILILYQFDLE